LEKVKNMTKIFGFPQITKEDLKCTCLSEKAKTVINQAFSHGINQEILHKKMWKATLQEQKKKGDWENAEISERIIKVIDQQLHNLNDTLSILKGLPECD